MLTVGNKYWTLGYNMQCRYVAVRVTLTQTNQPDSYGHDCVIRGSDHVPVLCKQSELYARRADVVIHRQGA